MASIRNYEPGNLDACRGLWVELTDRHREIYAVPEIGGDDPGLQFDEHLERVGMENLWVSVDGGEVVGLTGLLTDGGTVEVEPVVVSRRARSSGIGSALVRHVIAEARNRGVGLLSVRPVGRNRDAIRFFRRAGFEVIGQVEMFMDLTGEREWIAGETLAGEDFLV